MTRNVLEAVNKAREFFEIEGFFGDFFARLEKVDYTNKYNLLLFKEDIDKLSGILQEELLLLQIFYKNCCALDIHKR